MFSVEFDDFIKKGYKLKDKDGFLYCLYESISNSLYSCRERNDLDEFKIFIKFERYYEENAINAHHNNFIKSFTITDNGIGFTEKNFNNFTKTLFKSDSIQRKGIGRFAFSKVFKNVLIVSTFKENDKTFRRQFLFDDTCKDNKELVGTDSAIETTIKCDNFRNYNFDKYTKQSVAFYIEQIIKHFYTFLFI